MWDNIYCDSLESSVMCKYELELKKLSFREICYLEKKIVFVPSTFYLTLWQPKGSSLTPPPN